MKVTFASVTRAGLATPWVAEITHEGGFHGPIVLETTGDYWKLFDENGLDPEPSASRTNGDFLVWEFDPPDGDTLVVDFDARLAPAVHLGTGATTRVMVEGSPVAQVHYDTRVVP